MNNKGKTTTTSKKKGAAAASSETKIIFVIDESGSMSSAANDVRGGFNSYVEDLRASGMAYSLTAIKFGTRVRPLFADLPLAEVPLLDATNYTPRDTTALYDALGHAFAVAREKWATTEKPYGSDPVICVIMTDGFENASRDYDRASIVDGIAKRQQAGNWSFIYMGADQDAWPEASKLGIAQGNTMSYASGQTEQAFAGLSDATVSASVGYAKTGSAQTFGFFDTSTKRSTPSPKPASTDTDEDNT
jgi:uncharacterized protein YegL